MGEAGNRPKGKSYFARRIWDGPNDTKWHVWLAPAPRHCFARDPRPMLTFVQLLTYSHVLPDMQECAADELEAMFGAG